MIYRIKRHSASGLLAGVLLLFGVAVVSADDAPGVAWRLAQVEHFLT